MGNLRLTTGFDGGDHNDYMTNINLPFPFPDAVNQFEASRPRRWCCAGHGFCTGGMVNVV